MNPVRKAIVDLLKSDGELLALLADPPEGEDQAIFHRRAPQDAQPPYIILNKMTGTPTMTFKDNPLKDELWLVKGVSRDTDSAAEDIDRKCQSLLNRATLTIPGYDNPSLLVESDVDYGETVDGNEFQHVGAQYSIWVERRGSS